MFRIYLLFPLLVPLAMTERDLLGRLFHPFERGLDRLAARPGRALAAVGTFSFLLAMALSLGIRVPAPQTHDEFGYLLLGDTFAHGRVTNPTPPLYRHFETIHEIMQPTYTAKYPPAQGLALAAGMLAGLPIAGVWLSTALACAAVSWMLMAWMPARWALAGGLHAALHPLILEWSHDYWGGSVAMAGGALALGAFRRIVRAPRRRDAVWLGLGFAVIANSRPFEGFVFGGLLIAGLLAWTIRGGRQRILLLCDKVFWPLAIVLLLLVLQVGYYNWRVTGKPALMPYDVYQETYAMAPQFLFEQPRLNLVYAEREIRALHEQYLRYYMGQLGSWRALVEATCKKLFTLGQGYLWSGLFLVPLLALPAALKRDRLLKFVLSGGFVFLAVVLTETWMFPHSVAPEAGALFVVVMAALRALNGSPRGRNVVRGLAILSVISFIEVWLRIAHQDPHAWFYQREALLEKLKRDPQSSLVIVKYDPDHNPNREWVYNQADIPGAHVIIARDLGEAQNKELIDYFPSRGVWVVHADAAMPRLEPYPGS